LAPAREDSAHSDSFDPGLSTGYLRRGARDHDLPVEIGDAPFDPGPGTGYDERRARRDAKRRQRQEERRQDRLAKLEAEVQRRERDEREAKEREERERREAIDRKERERRKQIERELVARERLAREAREPVEREERGRREAAERERGRREAAQRDRERLVLEGQELRAKRRRELKRRPKERASAVRKRRLHEHVERQRRLHQEREQRRRKELGRRRRPGLGWPTARAALALAAVSAVAGVFGAAVGLPVPVLGEPGSPVAASLTGNSLLDSGTPPGLTKGPYFPVVTDNPNFGEADAKFGAERYGHTHQGQDVFVKPGTPLVAVRDGIVLDGGGGKSFYAYGGGNSLVVYSPVDDRSYIYLHMLHPALVHAGETVQAGQQVGQVGCSGSCDGPHLHFEIRLGQVAYGVERKAIDPLPLLQQWPAAPSL
jgi:murein DD-endopeptidase MepM/ murein hydrolase activator NlpD